MMLHLALFVMPCPMLHAMPVYCKSRYEYTVNTLEGSIMMMRVVDSTTYNEWTTLLKSIEDPNLKGPNLKIAKEGGSSPRLLSSSRLLAKEGSSP